MRTSAYRFDEIRLMRRSQEMGRTFVTFGQLCTLRSQYQNGKVWTVYSFGPVDVFIYRDLYVRVIR
jgi:hypothetical protein